MAKVSIHIVTAEIRDDDPRPEPVAERKWTVQGADADQLEKMLKNAAKAAGIRLTPLG